jgi:cytochrome c-type biogenesis protein CcmH
LAAFDTPLRAAGALAGIAGIVALRAAGPAPRTAPDGVPEPPVPMSAGDLREMAELPLVAARLRARLGRAPGTADDWALLARTEVALGRHRQARAAFDKAVALRGDDAALLADYADTLAYLNGLSFDGEPQALIERALRADPGHPGALLLAGLAAFDRREYAQATAFWERAALAGGGVADKAREGNREARRRAALPLAP